MRPELDEQLCQRHPGLFRQRHLTPQETSMCWGFECGDGWYPLIEVFCEEVESMMLNDDLPPVEITQVKEKLGSLRIRWQGGDSRLAPMARLIEAISERIDEVTGASRALQHQ